MIREEFDVFVSHASEDKARFVDALVQALRGRGLRVWYDANEIRLGDDFRIRIDEGLAQSRFGVVVLSPRFFKYWPQAELSALLNLEQVFGQTRILPIRLDLDHLAVTARSPLLATRAALGWELGVDALAERIHGRVRTVAVVARSPVYNLPVRRAGHLFGRDSDLSRLDQLLFPGSNVRIAASIEGLAGVGKTELALHVADRASDTDRFPGGIFWFDAEDPDLTIAWGTTIAEALAVGAGTVEDRAAAAVRIASNSGPILVILDNVESWTRRSEPTPLPRGRHVALLVTTRHRFLAGPSFAHHTLETLKADAAREFLISLAGRDFDGADTLLRYLDGHTLAIELAGAYLREFPSVSAVEYLRRLEEGMPVEEKVQDLVRYEATVRRALDVHWQHLEVEARKALGIAACFAPEDASTALLTACGVSDDALHPLQRFHLINTDGERWRMHRLVREWVRRTVSDEDLAHATRSFVQGCTEYFRRISLQGGFRIYQLDGPHLEQAARDVETALGTTDELVGRVLELYGTLLQTMGDLPRAKDLLERTLALDLKNLDEEHSTVASSRSNLAIVLRHSGDLYGAKSLLDIAVSSDLRTSRSDSQAAIIRRANLALILHNLGNARGARELLESVLTLAARRFGAHDLEIATIRSNLAVVVQDLGDLATARTLLESALESALKSLGQGHRSVAVIRSNLALVLQSQGDLPRAQDHLEQALTSDLANFGENHPFVAKTLSNLGVILKAAGDFSRAREFLERALSSDIRNLGEDHPSVAVRHFNLATLARDAGDLPVARTLFEKTLSAEERSLGADHPSTSLTRVSLAVVLQRLGETAAARSQADRARRAVRSQPRGSLLRVRVERAADQILCTSA